MRAVVQRVKEAKVKVKGIVKGSINRGLLVFAGVEKNDTEKDIEYMASKLAGLRVFEDGEGKMNLDLSLSFHSLRFLETLGEGGVLRLIWQRGRKGPRPCTGCL
jgi:hypothetical protein